MIVFDRVTKVSSRRRRKPVLASVSTTLPSNRRIAVLGKDERAKQTLLDLLAGMTLPTAGRIFRYARLSFPVGYTGALAKELSVRQNVAHVARLYGANEREVVEFVRVTADLGRDFDRRVDQLGRSEKQHLGIVLTYSLPFDVYLIDSAVTRGKEFRDVHQALFAERAKTAGIIFTARDAKQARQYCNMGAVLHRGNFVLYDNLEDAISVFDNLKGLPDDAPIEEDESEAEREEDRDETLF